MKEANPHKDAIPLVFLLMLSLFTFFLLSFSPLNPPLEQASMEEVCNNAIDDDNDGLIDLNDPDCDCLVVEPVSLIPNPSFEDMNCCPNDRSELQCADVWIQASPPTTDYLHTCGWMGWDEFPPPTPFPDGEGVMGFRDGRVRGNDGTADTNWKEYAGACLLSPLKAGTSYRFEFDVGFVNSLLSPPINITFFGTTDCQNLPFGGGNSDFGCPTNGPGWVRLGVTRVAGSGNSWVKSSIEVVPTEDITAIAIGPDCPAVQSSVSIYYFFDNLLLADFRAFELRIAEVEHPCSENFSLKIGDNPNYLYQWFKDGIALVGETFSQLTRTHGEGDYQVQIDDGQSCRLSTTYTHRLPVFTERMPVTICEEDVFPFGNSLLSEPGIYVDTFKTADNCDNIVTLDLKVLDTLADTVSARIFEGESYEVGNNRFKNEGEHLVNLVSSQGCDSLVLLQLEHYQIYIPNAFSPNQDGINDVFSVLGEPGLLQSSQLTIFDRWGVQVYHGTAWDGNYNGAIVNSGVYIYVAKLTMNDGIERQFSGSVTVVQ